MRHSCSNCGATIHLPIEPYPGPSDCQEPILRDFKILLVTGELVTVQGHRILTHWDADLPPNHGVTEVILDEPSPRYEDHITPRTVAVFPLMQIKGVFDGNHFKTWPE